MSSRYRGPRPTKPPTVALAINEIILHTGKWLRRYEESWFDVDYDLDSNPNGDNTYDGNDDQKGIPAIELDFRPAGDLDAIPGLCDYAIQAVACMAEFATEAASRLAEVKKQAERRIRQRKSGAGDSGKS